MSKPALLRTSLLLLLFTFSAENSFACMYGPPYMTVCESYALADSVVIGKVEGVESNMENAGGRGLYQRVFIKVERTFKGARRKELVLSQPQSTCDREFTGEVGETLLLFLVRDKKTKKYREIAGGVGGRVEREHENLYWLKNLPHSLTRTRLGGTVHVYQNQPFEFVDNVVGMKVRIFNAENSFEAGA